MALQSEVSPPLVGDPNKDTQIEGDTKSEDSSQSTDDEVDLEEGEILDSGAEEEEKKDLTNSSLKEALDLKCLKSLEQLVSQAKTDVPPPVINNKTPSPHSSPHKKKRSSKYLDHDRFENSDNEDGWYSPSHKRKSSKFDSTPIDYRKELEAYRGTPPSSPDSKRKKKRSSKKSKKSKKTRKDVKIRGSQYKKDSMKLKICKFYKDGNCTKGGDCGFSHANPHQFKKKEKKELCKFYLSGHCNKGHDCIYMHGEFPCKFYHTGSECYAKEACRFSHSPLNDEMKRVLADYLKISRDDDYDGKRRNSPSPEPRGPPPKRICLLGSPPRHIREAEETKRWQEEMLMQTKNHPGFQIHLSPSRDSLSPPPFTKPNFYQETLPSTPSPKKRRQVPEAANHSLSTSYPPPHGPSGGYPLCDAMEPYPERSPEQYMYDEDYRNMDAMNIKQDPPDFGWNPVHNIDHHPLPHVKEEIMEPFIDPAQQDLDFTNDVKFDETTQFSEMESSVDCNLSPSNGAPQITIKKEPEDEDSNSEVNKLEDKSVDDSSSAQEQPIPPPIEIPNHLPKKQKELFYRIQQHQKKNAMAAATSDASNSPKSYDNAENLAKEFEDTVVETEKNESLWYSSEDDDDNDDDIAPLTNVLKNLQKEPPPANPVKVEAKPVASIMAMLNKVQQNTLEKNKGVSETKQSDFFKNLLLGTIPSRENLQLPGVSVSDSEIKKEPLLPDPVIKKEPTIAPKDPRLKNRDPRTLANAAKTNGNEQPVSQFNPVKNFPLSSTMTTVITEPTKEDIPYKLHSIFTKPPNYTPILSASQSNPSLLKDPRLRKHLSLSQNNESEVDSKKDPVKNPPKDVPPMPKLLLEYGKPGSLNINIFEPSSTTKPIIDTDNVKPVLPKLIDPRIRRRESQNSTGSSTPPHVTTVENTGKTQINFENQIKLTNPFEKKLSICSTEKSWTPPLETNWKAVVKQEVDSDTDDPTRLEIDENPESSSTVTNSENAPPVVTKKSPPTPASHLPRAIADPRMAKLQNPLNSRRLRVNAPEKAENSNKNVELKKNNAPPEGNVLDSSKPSSSNSSTVESESEKKSKAIPKKSSIKSDEKKKTIHRNRKSSMDYASPLNSCDDSNSNKSLNYNSYNLRPQRTTISLPSSDSSVSSNSTNSVTPETIPDFTSDNSNLECDNSNDVNLKAMFKTIDPTASPFC